MKLLEAEENEPMIFEWEIPEDEEFLPFDEPFLAFVKDDDTDPETARLEHYMDPQEYRRWKSLPKTKKQRILRRIQRTAEYQDLAAAENAAAGAWGGGSSGEPPEPEGTSGAEGPQEDIDGGSTGGTDTGGSTGSAGDATGGAAGGGTGIDPLTPEGGKARIVKAAKKAARIISGELKKAADAGAELGQDEQTTEAQLLKKGTSSTVMTWQAVRTLATVWKALIGALGPLLLIPLAAVVLVCISIAIGNPYGSSENAGIMPYYAQADYLTPFNGGTIKSDGCGITSMAMVVSLFSGQTVTPPELAALAAADSAYNTVTSHKAIAAFAAHYGLNAPLEMNGPGKVRCCSLQAYDSELIRERIAAGSPVILSVTGGYYNPGGGGHYIAVYGVGAHGVFVYDPGSRQKYLESVNADGKALEDVLQNAKHIWIFEPYSFVYASGSGSVEGCVWQNLKAAGFSDAAAAGVIGNMYQESAHGFLDLRPAAQSRDGSIGLLQWTGGRADGLQKLAANRAKDWRDPAVQIEFLLQELNGGAQWKWTGYAGRHYAADLNMNFTAFKQISDPQRAAEAFCATFVRPNYEKSNLRYRKEKAQEIFDKYTR